MCGVVGVLRTKSVRHDAPLAIDAFRSLTALQHRGQDACGIVSYDFEKAQFHHHKDLGLVNDVFKKGQVFRLMGDMAIGHTRYATVGSNDYLDIQPIISGYPVGVALAHNGNLVNYHAIKNKLREKFKIQPLTNNDVECFLNLFNFYLAEINIQKQKHHTDIGFGELSTIAKKILDEVEGAYSIVGLLANKGMFGIRDPNGIRPLVLGKKIVDDSIHYCLASETAALHFSEFEYVRDIAPGELVFINPEGQVVSKILTEAKRAHCMFEWVYFAGAETDLDGLSVYKARLHLGKQLAKQVNDLIQEGTIAPDFVSPVPDTSRTASISLAEELHLPYRESLIKNRYVQRSFILNSQKMRENVIKRKLIPIRSEIIGKKILLVDDSIVRGTTSRKIVSMLKEIGAKEVYMAVTCPPIRYSCYYGIDFPDSNELIGNNKTEEEIAQETGADKVIYLKNEALREALENKQLCTGCLDGVYPTKLADGKNFANLRNEEKRSSNENSGTVW